MQSFFFLSSHFSPRLSASANASFTLMYKWAPCIFSPHFSLPLHTFSWFSPAPPHQSFVTYSDSYLYELWHSTQYKYISCPPEAQAAHITPPLICLNFVFILQHQHCQSSSFSECQLCVLEHCCPPSPLYLQTLNTAVAALFSLLVRMYWWKRDYTEVMMNERICTSKCVQGERHDHNSANIGNFSLIPM